MDTTVWLLLLIVFLVVEVVTVGLTSIWFALGAVFAAITSALNFSVPVQIIVFIVSSVLFIVFTRPLAVKFFKNKRVKTNYEGVIGQSAKVTETINNIENKGTVIINGLEWTAKSEDDSIIEKDSVIEVVKVEGVKVIVKKIK